MSEYGALRQRHRADAVALIPEMVARLSWSPEQVAAHRTAKLRHLIREASARSPWHRRRLAHLDPACLDLSRLAEIPPMTKADLMEHFDEIATDDRLRLDVVERHLQGLAGDAYLFDRYHAIASGGSSGHRGVFVYDWDAWAIFYLLAFRHLLARSVSTTNGGGPTPVVAALTAENPRHAGTAMHMTFSGPHLRSVPFPVTLPIDEIVGGLNELQPTVLYGYPSAVFRLVPEVTAGRLRIHPQQVDTAGEPLFPGIRCALEAAWGVPVGNKWGASESTGLGTPCQEGGTHLIEDLVVVEPVDGDGRPVSPGTRSAKVYLTNLYNLALPLIRYELTDEVTVVPGECPCGWGTPRIADVQGRLDDTFVYGDLAIHPHVFRSPLGRRAEIVEYQVCQTERGAAIAVVLNGVASFDPASLTLQIAANLERLGMRTPEVSVAVVDHLERLGTGKLKRFVTLQSTGT